MKNMVTTIAVITDTETLIGNNMKKIFCLFFMLSGCIPFVPFVQNSHETQACTELEYECTKASAYGKKDNV
jgi:hypothetical protein